MLRAAEQRNMANSVKSASERHRATETPTAIFYGCHPTAIFYASVRSKGFKHGGRQCVNSRRRRQRICHFQLNLGEKPIEQRNPREKKTATMDTITKEKKIFPQRS